MEQALKMRPWGGNIQRLLWGAGVIGLPLMGCHANPRSPQNVDRAIQAYRNSHASVADSYTPPHQPDAPPPGSREADQIPVSSLETSSDLGALIKKALQHNPSILAAEAKCRAASNKFALVTSLPDPMLSSKTWVEPIRTAEGDSYFVLGILQRLPNPAKLDQAGRIATSQLEIALARLEERRIQTIADVKRRYFQLYVLDRRAEITLENQDLLQGLIDVARAQVSGGRQSQADVLRAQVELSNLEAELIALRQKRRSTAKAIQQLMGHRDSPDIMPPRLINLREAELSANALIKKAQIANPQLSRLREQVSAAEERMAMAKLARRPDLVVGLDWMNVDARDALVAPRNPSTGRRPMTPQLSEDGHDNWAITLGFTLPIWSSKVDAGIDEAKENVEATRHQLAAAEDKILFKIEDALERVGAQRDLASLLTETVLVQAQQAFQVSQASYVAGKTSFLNVIENWRKWLSLQILYHQSLGELEQSIADLEQAVGLSLNKMRTP